MSAAFYTNEKMKKQFKAALFDLDGVVLDTEGQYTEFWGGIGRELRPDIPDFGQRIKGQTLTQIFDAWFPGDTSLQADITRRLDDFEAHMTFQYIKGVHTYVEHLRTQGIHTAIVTSSNQPKMESVYRSRPELTALFDRILTAEDFRESKPSPDCYLRGAAVFGLCPEECVVFEDSVNGLKAGRASGAHVIGLATTNPREVIENLCDEVIDDFTSLPLIEETEETLMGNKKGAI